MDSNKLVIEFSVEELGDFLASKGFDETVLTIFKEQEIDGQAFFGLEEGDFAEMKVKIGPKRRIKALMTEYGTKVIDVPELIDTTVGSRDPPREQTLEPARASAEELSFDITFEENNERSLPNGVMTSSPLTGRSMLTSAYSAFGSVREILSKHKLGPKIIENANLGGTNFSEKERCALVRIITADLVLHHGFYPPDSLKLALAKGIVDEFPKLKDSTPSVKGYEHYFDPATRTGFIENRLQNMRKDLSPSKKRYKPRSNSTASKDPQHDTVGLMSEADLNEKISWMRLKLPTDANKSAINHVFVETFGNRRKWILNDKPTIREIFDKYPRLLDYDAEMIDEEFKRIDEAASELFLQKFALSFAPLLLTYGEAKRPDVSNKFRATNISDENLKALLYLQSLLPTNNSTRGGRNKRARLEFTPDPITATAKGDVPDPSLIRIVPENTNLDEYCARVYEEAQGTVQPYLIAARNGEDLIFYIVVDSKIIPLGRRKGVLNAFDMLFKTHFVTNAEYAPSLKFFYNFLEVYIYCMKDSKPFNSVRALNISLQS